jgi:hypothetical protein
MADPIMPSSVRDWLDSQVWGLHHLQWHNERRWNILPDDARNWAINHGWTKAERQEGTPGNGLEFLAMHRVMLGRMRSEFPALSNLFQGWPTPPQNPHDPANPLPGHRSDPFSANMTAAIEKIETLSGTFADDDDFGLYIETRLRPTDANPRRESTDRSTGLHNYLHQRFSDPTSPVDMGQPNLNLYNQIFWRLHGWIDNQWTAFRTAKGLQATDEAYITALKEAEDHMSAHHHMMFVSGGNEGLQNTLATAPPSLFRVFESAGEGDCIPTSLSV